jgi:hypothetical protein
LTFTNGWSRRPDSWKIVRATSSLPVPLSPRTEHRDVGVGDLLDDLADLAHLLVVAAQEQQLGLRARATAQPLDLLLEAPLLERLLERELELLDLERLAQEVRSAQTHRLDDVARLSVAREHHDRHVRGTLLEPAQRLEAVDPRQHDVERHDVGSRVVEARQRLLGVRGEEHPVPLARHERLHVVADTRVVIDDENAERLRGVIDGLHRALGHGASPGHEGEGLAAVVPGVPEPGVPEPGPRATPTSV